MATALRKIGRSRSLTALTLASKPRGSICEYSEVTLRLRLTRGSAPQAASSMAGEGGPRGGLGGQAVEQVEVGALVGEALRFAHGGLAEHVQREADALPAQGAEGRDRVAGVPAHDEPLRERLHLAADDGARQRRHG